MPNDPAHPLHRFIVRPVRHASNTIRFTRYFAAAILDDLAQLVRPNS